MIRNTTRTTQVYTMGTVIQGPGCQPWEASGIITVLHDYSKSARTVGLAAKSIWKSFRRLTMSFAAAIYQGSCSGHGVGTTPEKGAGESAVGATKPSGSATASTHHPGLGGSILPKCTIPANTDIKVKPKTS